MKQSITLRRICATAAVLLASQLSVYIARAQSTWDGGGTDNNWGTPANWVGDIAPPNNGTDDIHFAGSARPAPNTDAPWTLLSLTYDAGATAFTNGGSLLTIQSGGILNNSSSTQTINNAIKIGAAQTWNAFGADLTFGSTATVNTNNNLLTIDGANDTTINGVISGTGGLTKNGGGTLTLGAANTFTGDVTLTAGNITAGVNGALPNNVNYTINGGTLNLNSFNLAMKALSGTGGTITLGSATLTVNQTTTTAYDGVISGTGGFSKQGTGVLTLTGNNTFTGPLSVSGGGLTLTGNNSALTGAVTVSGGGTLTSGGATALPGSVDYTINDGTLDLAGNALTMSSLTGTSATGEIKLGVATLTVDQTTSTTYAGKISGTGDLVKSNTGTLILTGTNTYTGNTNITGGTLQGDTNSIQGDVAVSSGAHVTFNQTADASFANQISGAGDFTKMGTGKLTLTNTTNSYTGGTTVSGGTLTSGATGAIVDDTTYNVGSGATLDLNDHSLVAKSSSASVQALTGSGTVTLGSLAATSLTVDTTAGNSTFSGVISGSGKLIKDGSNTLILGGANTYGGGTNVLNGTLQGTTTSLQGTISAASGTVVDFNQATNGTYAGALSGAGDVMKDGAGTVTFTGTKTYTGLTTINAGRLDVNGTSTSVTTTVGASGTLGGTGTITGNVTNNGIITGGTSASPTGALNINNGTLDTSTGTMQVNLGASSNVSSKINVNNGNATLTGGTLNIVSAGSTHNAGETFSFLSYNTLTGQFGTVTDDLSGLDAVVTYNANEAIITLLRNGQSFAAIAQTRNQLAVGNYLDLVSPGATGDLQTVLNGINGISNAEARSAFDQLSGAIHGTLGQIGIQNTTVIVQQLGYRLRSAPFAAGGDNDDSPGPDGQPGPETMGAASKRDSSPVVLVGYNPDGSPCLQECPDGGHCCLCTKGWVQGYGLGGNAKTDGNVLGLTYAMGGVMGGAERWVDDCHKFGFWGGYVGTNVESDGNQKISGGQFGGYMFSDNDSSYSIWLGGFEFDSYNTERQMAFDGINRLASADYDGWQGFGYWERGVTYGSCNRILQPFVALQYIYLRQNSFTESGANSVDLLSGGLDTWSFRSMLGARMQYALYARNGKRFLPEIHALWLHEYLNSDTVVTANFAGATTPGSFAVNGIDLGRDWAMLGASTTWELGGGWNMFVNYDCQTNSQQTLHVGSGGLGHMW